MLPAGWRVVKKPDPAKAETKTHMPMETKIESEKIGTGRGYDEYSERVIFHF